MKNGLIKYESMAVYLNDRVLTHYFNELMLIAKSIYEWVGLPDNMDEKWIENYLFSEGKCLFFKDDIRGHMVTSLAPNGRFNTYNEETIVRPHAIEYFSKEVLVNGEDCVIIRNNDESLPTTESIQLFAFKLAQVERTIHVNIEALKTPVVVECTDKERMSYRNFMKQRNDNEPMMFVSDKMNTNGIKVHALNPPLVFKDLELQKHMIWNEAMTYLGLNNSNQDKRERLVTNEVEANNEQVEGCLNAGLKARERACREINRIFGTNISVRKRIQETPKLSDSEPSEEDLNDSEGGDE